MAEDADIKMEAEFETENQAWLDFIPLTISVDGKDLIAVEDQEMLQAMVLEVSVPSFQR